MTTHSRTLAANTARRPTAVVSARARARDAAKEKQEEEKIQRREEVRRLKSLKRKEVEDKLKKILEAAGSGAAGIDGVDLDGDWDPEAHDRKMAEVYGEEYLGADVRTCFWSSVFSLFSSRELTLERQDDDFKPAWDDDIDISDLQAAEDAEDGGDVDMEQSYDPSASVAADKKARKDKGKRKRDEEGFPTALLEAAKNGGDAERKALLESMVDEYYGLDYEDKVRALFWVSTVQRLILGSSDRRPRDAVQLHQGRALVVRAHAGRDPARDRLGAQLVRLTPQDGAVPQGRRRRQEGQRQEAPQGAARRPPRPRVGRRARAR